MSVAPDHGAHDAPGSRDRNNNHAVAEWRSQPTTPASTQKLIPP